RKPKSASRNSATNDNNKYEGRSTNYEKSNRQRAGKENNAPFSPFFVFFRTSYLFSYLLSLGWVAVIEGGCLAGFEEGFVLAGGQALLVIGLGGLDQLWVLVEIPGRRCQNFRCQLHSLSGYRRAAAGHCLPGMSRRAWHPAGGREPRRRHHPRNIAHVRRAQSHLARRLLDTRYCIEGGLVLEGLLQAHGKGLLLVAIAQIVELLQVRPYYLREWRVGQHFQDAALVDQLQ